MKRLLPAWNELTPRFQGRRQWMILLDYDGTLAPIAATPQQAVLSASMRSTLRRLSRSPRIIAGIVSGRSLSEVRRCVGIAGLIYAGNHGFELRGRGLAFVHPATRRCRKRLAALNRRLKAAVSAVSGAWVEWKGLTISAHWRNVPKAQQQRFKRLVKTATASELSRRDIRVTYGKRVIEIRPPVAWDKGRLVSWLAGRLCRGRSCFVCYVGDDRTDEDAFRAVNRLRGLSVFVGGQPRDSCARFQLSGPQEVERWLKLLMKEDA